MDTHSPSSESSSGKRRPTSIELIGRQERNFSISRNVLIWAGIGFIVAAVALIAALSISSARDVFGRYSDRFKAVDSPPQP